MNSFVLLVHMEKAAAILRSRGAAIVFGRILSYALSGEKWR